MKLSDAIIEEYVKKMNETTPSYDYKQGLGDMKALGLETVTPGDVNAVIKPFLYRWGWMQRVLERLEYSGWEDNLAGRIRYAHKQLEPFRTMDLEETELDGYESTIKTCYKDFNEVVGPIAAAKALHFICPDFFPPWDRRIAKTAQRERATGGRYLSPEDYYLFMRQIRCFIRKSATVSRLARRYGKGKVKISDEILWSATQRPLQLIFS